MAAQRRWLLSPLAVELNNGRSGGSKPSCDEVASTTARREGGRWLHDCGGFRALSPWRLTIDAAVAPEPSRYGWDR
ncbi:hypothetical protein OsI_38118 [Oryza sativa Indica Group]|jgi:hypothetical protein|uniref:Uncharacterized protein n=1 Tax=Oryza sativa subsp. indica TaxID=39946 RepID=A2ZJX1_ORYSI|nr:hypothetical protein OsI_38118 [Oryza sativa Indica Group]